MILKVLDKCKIRYKLITNYYGIKRKNVRKQTGNSLLPVYFNLKDIRQEPYYYPIIFSFHEAGYTVYIVDNKKFIGHSFAAARFIFELPRVIITKRPERSKSILITDNEIVFKEEKGWNKKLLLQPDAFAQKSSDTIFLPYPMHPNAYHHRYFEKAQELRKNKRKCRILFSGNTDSIAYQNPLIKEKFGKLNRVEVISQLIRDLPPESVGIIRKKEDIENKVKDCFKGALFYLWQWAPQKSQGLDIRVPNNQWHDFLATGDFFLCCPGIVIPQSHNAIEAMSVGTIPILQYPEYFHPALEHGMNCIAFSSEEDLLLKVKEVLSMDQNQIEQIRINVIEYYEEYLRHDSPAKLIASLPDGSHKIYFYNEAV